jgi:RHS repeat-associated protein
MDCRLFLPAVLLLAAAGAALAADAPLRAKPAATDVQWSTGAYSYDGSGNITTIGPGTDGYTDTYRYDLLGRLVTSTTGPNTQTFTYDALGNLRFIGNASGTGLSMPINPVTNRIDGTDPIGSNIVTAGYDEAGNETVHNGAYHYAFDGVGMMATLTAAGRAERYLYDADDERVASVSSGGSTQRWRYTVRDLDARFVREYVDDATGGAHAWRWTKDYVYTDTGRLVGTIAAKGTGGEERRHFHPDHLGTPRLITADDGTILSRRALLPFGEETATPDESEVIGFTGHERDYAPGSDTNDLDSMHARHYAPRTGRFLSVDPGRDWDLSQPQSWNAYAYARNSPINLADPTGRCTYIPCLNAGKFEGEMRVTAPAPPSDAWEYIVDGLRVPARQYNAEMAAFHDRADAELMHGLAGDYDRIEANGHEYFVALPLAGRAAASTAVANAVSANMARVIPGELTPATLGRPGATDVFVTAYEDIAGLDASQIGTRLGIPQSDVYTVIRFRAPVSGVASPINRAMPGFVGRGLTSGGAREFVIPNGPIPWGGVIRTVRNVGLPQ